MRRRSDYEKFEADPETRRLLRQEELILEVTEALVLAIERQGLSRAALARRLGKSRAFVSQALAGGRNLTLRTVADLADAVGGRLRVHVEGQEAVSAESSPGPTGWRHDHAWTTRQRLDWPHLEPRGGGASGPRRDEERCAA